MNRFTNQKKRSGSLVRLTISVIVFCGCVLFLMRGISTISTSASDSEIDSLRSAISRSAVHCYAMEGHYPESLSYLKEHYGIHWDSQRYVVDYEITGANRMPIITIIPLNRKEGS